MAAVHLGWFLLREERPQDKYLWKDTHFRNRTSYWDKGIKRKKKAELRVALVSYVGPNPGPDPVPDPQI
jgi:hypothetical protein